MNLYDWLKNLTKGNAVKLYNVRCQFIFCDILGFVSKPYRIFDLSHFWGVKNCQLE